MITLKQARADQHRLLYASVQADEDALASPDNAFAQQRAVETRQALQATNEAMLTLRPSIETLSEKVEGFGVHFYSLHRNACMQAEGILGWGKKPGKP